jgi:hypothetical protein
MARPLQLPLADDRATHRVDIWVRASAGPGIDLLRAASICRTPWCLRSGLKMDLTTGVRRGVARRR